MGVVHALGVFVSTATEESPVSEKTGVTKIRMEETPAGNPIREEDDTAGWGGGFGGRPIGEIVARRGCRKEKRQCTWLIWLYTS